MRLPSRALAAFVLVPLVHLVLPAAARAALGPGSVLAIDVWQHPELSHESTVRADGRIEFPPVGELRAEGLSTTAISQRISDGLSGYMREPAYVTVREVFPVTVAGFVAKPGRVVLERAPTLLEAILESGGPLPGAWLDRVMVYRPGPAGAAPNLQIVSVSEAFARGQSAATPPLERGDLVFVRGEAAGGALAGGGGGAGAGTGTAGGAATGGTAGMVLFKGTARPGLYAIPDGADLYTAIALAGGPAPGADLRHVRVLSLQGDRRVAYEVDLEALGAGAPPHPFLLRDGDVVEMKASGEGFLSRTWHGTRDVLTLSSSLASAYLLIHSIRN